MQFRLETEIRISETPNLTRRPEESKLSDVMTRKPESKSFLGKDTQPKELKAGFFYGKR
jgi:hypothetical protein